MRKQRLIRSAVWLALLCGLTAAASFPALADWERAADGRWRYGMDAAGYATGWEQLNGEWYYFDAQGYMQTGWIEDQGRWYYLDGSGAMQRDCWIGGYYVDGGGVWVQGTDKGKKEITFTDFQTIREDIDGDGIEERFELSQSLTGVKLSVRLSGGVAFDVPFDGIYQPQCEITICDLGTGENSLLVQLPTYGTDERYWAKCFLKQNGAYQEALVPDYTYSGYFHDEYQYQLVCDNTDFKVKAGCISGEEHKPGQLVRSGDPMRYEVVHDASFDGYLVKIRQEIYAETDVEDVVGTAAAAIGWKDGRWQVFTQELEKQ